MIIKQFVDWLFAPSIKPISDEPIFIDELYERISDLEQRVKMLEEENVGTTNELYRMENSLDARIDILAERCRIDYNV